MIQQLFCVGKIVSLVEAFKFYTPFLTASSLPCPLETEKQSLLGSMCQYVVVMVYSYQNVIFVTICVSQIDDESNRIITNNQKQVKNWSETGLIISVIFCVIKFSSRFHGKKLSIVRFDKYRTDKLSSCWPQSYFLVQLVNTSQEITLCKPIPFTFCWMNHSQVNPPVSVSTIKFDFAFVDCL